MSGNNRFQITGLDTALDFQQPGTTSAALTAATGSPWAAALQGIGSFFKPKPLNIQPTVIDTTDEGTPPATVAAYAIMILLVIGAGAGIFYLIKK